MKNFNTETENTERKIVKKKLFFLAASKQTEHT